MGRFRGRRLGEGRGDGVGGGRGREMVGLVDD